MINLKPNAPMADIVAGLCGLFMVLIGISGVESAIYSPQDRANWKICAALIIFGSMIMGVAINRVSNSFRHDLTPTKKGKDKNYDKS